ncbi:MAG: hypothetical protein LV481_14570 [Methylacidiphilales bacterium]|nr:hypothetical protein [Candidatus Methylacidiphilales bacterium]
MPGKSFQSKLEPHFDLILEAKRKRQTWEAIAQQLAAQGVATTKQAVHAFVKRRLKRRYPLGMAPAPSSVTTGNLPQSEKSAPEPPELTESPPPASEFATDPLTKPIKGKPKSKWTVFKPNP